MDRGIPKVGLSLNAQHAARTCPKQDREREEQADFAEAVEHRDQKESQEPTSEAHLKPDFKATDVGYPNDDEAGNSLDLKA